MPNFIISTRKSSDNTLLTLSVVHRLLPITWEAVNSNNLMKRLTQEHLKELFEYDKDTGAFKLKEAGKVSAQGYVVIWIEGKKYLAHRLTFLYMTGELPEHHVDHINHDRSDNRWCNLREVTNAENLKNLKKLSRNTSGITGVSFLKNTGKWRAQISTQKIVHLGTFTSKEDAARAYEEAKIKHGFHPNHGK